MLDPITGTSLTSAAQDRIVEAICSGQFEPGEKLSEARLARELGISRGPLREALRQLEGRLVTRTPRIGVRVIALGRAEIEQLFLIREALEGMAARLAAEKITPQEIDELNVLLERDAAQPALAAGSAYLPHASDTDFHMAIVTAARSPKIKDLLLDAVYYQLRIHRLRSSARPGRARAALEEHHEIVAALQSHDPDIAERMMRKHIRNARFGAVSAAST